MKGGKKVNVKLARIKKGLTQNELCKIVKIGPRKLVQIEKGNYDNVTKLLMNKLATALDSTVQELFFSEENQ